MKYIRTNDGKICKLCIHEIIVLEDGIEVARRKERLIDGYYDFATECKIIKEADTIEKLCDEFIVDANYKDKPYLYDRDEPVNSPEFTSEDEVVYGGIWTTGEHGEPILKPVAKLNEKGEWKLL